MPSGYDIAYLMGVALAAPYWALRGRARRKVMGAFRQRMGDVARREGDAACVMIHAVSLGEMNATRALVRKLGEARPELEFVISTTTETGFARGMELYGADARVRVIRYPLDFSWAVGRVLDRLRPWAVVLMELEVWPNFMRECERREIPVVLVNGRVTESSYRGYRLIRPVADRMLRRLARVCVQDETYAERFVRLGAPRERVMVTGTMKFDTAEVGEGVAGDVELAAAVGLRAEREAENDEIRMTNDELNPNVQMMKNGAEGHSSIRSYDIDSSFVIRYSSFPIWVCGSTGPGEEEMVLGAYRRLRERFEGLRLVIVPRKPERFDEVAELIRREGFGVVRRSERMADGRSEMGDGGWEIGGRETTSSISDLPSSRLPVVLGDTMGELRKFYSLADVVFVGRSLVDLGPRQHGSDMIEPAALGKPVVVGPFTGNFSDAMMKLRAAGAVQEVGDAGELEAVVGELLGDPDRAREMGRKGQEVVRREQGATERHVGVVLEVLRGVGSG